MLSAVIHIQIRIADEIIQEACAYQISGVQRRAFDVHCDNFI